MTLHDRYLRRTPRSAIMHERAKACMPDGVSTDTRFFEPYGLYIASASGVHKQDVDGNRYLDYFGGHGALMLGHSHPVVVEAVQRAMEKGIQYAASNPAELEWAEAIKRHVGSAESVRFTGSGTETTLLALRVARAFTGRKKVLRIASHYHGWHDFAASGYLSNLDGSAAPGVLPEIAAATLLVAPGDEGGLARAFADHGDSIAAVIAEPLGAHFGLVPTADDFIVKAGQYAREHGALMILDEVISGFRVCPGGMQHILGIRPDLTCLAKVTAGGLPGGALVGRKQVLDILARRRGDGTPNAQRVLHQGTFTGNPVTAAAALATINLIVARDACTHASVIAEYLRQRVNNLFTEKGLSWRAEGRYSGIHLRLPDSATLRGDLRIALNLEGVDIGSRGTLFVCAEHTRLHADECVHALERAIDGLREDRLID